MRCGAVSLLLLPWAVTVAPAQQAPVMRHSHQWVLTRLKQMVAMDDAYLWHDLLGGRAIHQNSRADPPTAPLEGNFHTQQQAFYAAVKMDLYDLGGRREPRHLDDAGDLLEWVLANGYDAQKQQFLFKYNIRTEQWDKSFYPEFNMMSVSALLTYDSYRPSPEFTSAALNVLERIVQTEAFQPEGPKSLYASGYLALKLLDAYDATKAERYLSLARQVVDLANQTMWDAEHGGWLPSAAPDGAVAKHTTKFTHTIANMVQACFRLYLHVQGDEYRQYATEGLEFLAQHSRSPDGGWYRHTTRDGSDPTRPPGIGDGGTTEPGTPCVYDRMAQVMVACCLGYRATQDERYLKRLDETLDKMEQTHLTTYPTGVNYGYISAGDYQNTWCHLWGLKAFIAIARLQESFLEAAG